MQITLLHNDNLITLSVSPDTTVAALISLAQSEPQLRYNAQQHTLHISFAGSDITSQTTATLSALNVQDNDVLQVTLTPRATQSQQQPQPQPQRNMSPNEERAMLEMALLEQALEDDPMNPDLQRRLEQIIQQKNIQENLESAMENNPEAFAHVIMLYVPMEVNNQQLTAFVDSGAQSTIMSLALAKRCNLEHLIDKRFAGMAVGVGTQPIVGRVHSAKVKIGDVVLVCSFTILQESSIDLLLGLDQLKRHAMSINLGNNSLEIYDNKVPFLSEHQLPAKYRKSDNGGESADSEMSDGRAPTASSSTSQSRGHALGHSGASATTTGQRSTPQQAAAAAALQRQQQSQTSAPAAAAQPATNAGQMTPQQQAAWLAALLATAQQSQPSQQQSQSQHSPAQQQQSNTQQTTHSADKIASLTQLGFTSGEAVQALNATGGDVDAAAGLLFSR